MIWGKCDSLVRELTDPNKCIWVGGVSIVYYIVVILDNFAFMKRIDPQHHLEAKATFGANGGQEIDNNN